MEEGSRMSTLRLGLAQINPTVGDLDGNATQIALQLEEARDLGVEVVAFPELAVCGYPPEDLLLKPGFIAANRRAVERLCRSTRGLTAVVGFAERDGHLFNSAAVLHDGEWKGTYRKQRLPNYGVFDEVRYFKAGTGELLLLRGEAAIGISICEDAWTPAGPIARLARAGADIVININASPYERGKWKSRHRMLATRASDHALVIGYVNMVGGQDELVFDGDSMVVGPGGELLAEAPPFRETLLVCDVELEQVFRARLQTPRSRSAAGRETNSVRRMELPAVRERAPRQPLSTPPPVVHDDVAEVYAALVVGTRDYIGKNGFKSVVIGLSGGIDSALVAAVAVDALGPDQVTGVSMPSRYSSEGSRDDAAALAEALGIRMLSVPIEPLHSAALETMAPLFEGREPGLAEENIQARLRGLILMGLSNKFDWLLLTTGNKSEMATGYSTLYGDMAGGFAVIKDVSKLLVYELARWRNATLGLVIPESVLGKPPSAELRPNQQDSDSLPPYDILDPILERYVEQDWSLQELVQAGFDEQVVRRIIGLVDRSEYKRRQSAPGIKVTPRSFGKDRRLPITSRYLDA
jgi:NAD+ synthase (glutamine-hydrolysing)